MDYIPSGYMYCHHCNEKVSESTYRRHMNLFSPYATAVCRNVRVPEDTTSSSSEDESADISTSVSEGMI